MSPKTIFVLAMPQGIVLSPFGQLDAELRIPSFGYLSDDNSHPLSYDTSGGGQLMLSQTAWVPHKSFLSPVHIMAYSVINSVQGHGLYSLVKPLLMRTHDLKQVKWSRELSNGTPIEIHVISPRVHGSQSSSNWVDHRTSLLPHFGTVVISPIRHASYGLLKPSIIITQDVPRCPTDGPGSLYLMQVPQLYLCPEEAI